jgi:hypothetical protein
LVATGHDGLNYLDAVEIFDISAQNSKCQPIPPFPLKLIGAFGGLLNGKLPTICGGFDGTNYRRLCYSLRNRVWERAPLYPAQVANASSALFPATDMSQGKNESNLYFIQFKKKSNSISEIKNKK